MRLNTSLMFDLARGVEADRLGVDEQQLIVVPQISPVITLQGALRDLQFNASDRQQVSFSQEFQSFQTGVAAGASTTIAIFAEGLWDVWAAFTHVTDLAEAITADPRAGLQLIDPQGNTTRLLIAVAGTAKTEREGRWRFLFPRVGNWLLTHFVEATVVGQERYAHSAIVCNRLA